MTKVNKFSVMLMAAFAAVSLLSCSKEDNVVVGESPIGFYCSDVWTKAMVSQESDMYNEGFQVYAHAEFDESGEIFDFNKKVTYNLTDGWNYNNQKQEYWLPRCSYTFRAYYPSSLTSIIDDQSAIKGFEITPEYGEQQDILMASASRTTAQTLTDGSAINFNFQHILSNINVILKVDQVERDGVDEDGNPIKEKVNAIEADVKAVRLVGVARKADYINGWVNHSGSASVGVNVSEAIPVTADGVSIFENGLLAIPQTVNGDVSLYILADITLPTGTKMQKQWNPTLPDRTWNANTKYNYTVKLTAEFNIEFEEPKVETWAQEQMSGTVVIR